MILRKAFTAALLAISISIASPPWAEASSDYSASSQVVVVQNGAGSFFGILQWSPVEGANSYLIYKTGSIRPGWRKFASTSFRTTSITVSDRPGAIAIYRVVAIISGKEIEIGTFKYFPRR